MKKEILVILSEIRAEFDFNTADSFIEAGMLDSFDVVTLVTMLDDKFGISIDGVDVVPSNFESLESIELLVKRSLKK